MIHLAFYIYLTSTFSDERAQRAIGVSSSDIVGGVGDDWGESSWTCAPNGAPSGWDAPDGG